MLEEAGFDIVIPQSRRLHTTPVLPALFELFPELKSRDEDLPEWYNAYDNEDGTKRLEGLPEALQFLQQYLKEQEPFDAIVGHSQGAQLASILTLLMETDESFLPDTSKHWKLLVAFNAPNPIDTVATSNIKDIVAKHGPLKTRSVHITGGPSDHTFEGSERLMTRHFTDPSHVGHEEGHFLPKDAAVCAQIVASIRKALAEQSVQPR